MMKLYPVVMRDTKGMPFSQNQGVKDLQNRKELSTMSKQSFHGGIKGIRMILLINTREMIKGC